MRRSGIRALVDRARESTLVQNALTLYGVHAAGLLLPLVTIPYLARVLRPEGWGLVVFAQSFAAWLALLLEFGFYLSATRLIARVREDRRRVAEVVADVQGARGLLLLVLAVVGLAAYALVPAFRQDPRLLVWAWLSAVAQGLTPFWYFQGVERMRGAALLEVGGRAAATAGIFLFVKGTGDGWLVLALQAVTGFLWVAIATSWVYREVDLVRPRLRGAMAMLREAAGLFLFRGATGLYIQANSFLLGLVASAPVVGYFGGAEKIVRAGTGLLHPATQALYPRISHLAATDRQVAQRLVRLSLMLVGGLGVGLGLIIALGAPVLVRLLLGPGYEPAVPILRTLSLLLPIIALGTVLGIQWALPMGFDRPFYSLVLGAGLLNVVLALLLAPRFGAEGMAISVVLADSMVSGGLLLLAWREARDLWRLPSLSTLRRGIAALQKS